jgi:hypothetical protein
MKEVLDRLSQRDCSFKVYPEEIIAKFQILISQFCCVPKKAWKAFILQKKIICNNITSCPSQPHK